MLRNVVKVSSVGCGYPTASGSSVRFRSTQVQPQPVATADSRDPEWDSALPYSKVPGPGVFTMLKNFAPGGESEHFRFRVDEQGHTRRRHQRARCVV